MMWDWAYAQSILPRIAEGLTVTLQATVLATVLALVVGLGFALGRRSSNVIIRNVFYWLCEFIRRTPVLVQMYFVFFVLPRLGLTLPALTSGILALGLHTSAYMSEVYRAGIESVPKGQWEAARALNIPIVRLWVHVILPQALPPMIPAAGNYVLMMFKETALLSTITVLEMMGTARVIGNETYRYFEPITIVGAIYLAISLPAAMVVRWVEEKIRRSKKSGA